LFHGKRHPRELGLPAVNRFLEHVVRTDKQPLPALETARSALELLYAGVLGLDLGELPRPRLPRLPDQMSQVLRVRHYSPRTEACYLHWVRQFILFHGKRHPRELGAAEVEQFLTHLAVQGHVSASTQNQALNALVFLYKQVLEIDLGPFEAVRARRAKRLPVVLAPEEVAAVLEQVQGAGTSRGGANCTSATWPGAWLASNCRTRWSGSTRGRPRSWAGSSCSRRGRCRSVRAQGGWAGTTSTRPRSNGPSHKRGGLPG
jgi:hypothetical protein